MVLIGCLVLEQFDTGAVASADHPYSVDDCARVDVHELVHEVPLRVAERPEREGVGAAEQGGEPLGRRVHVGDGDADVVDAEQPRHRRDLRVEPVALR